jgi:hypothetical protein
MDTGLKVVLLGVGGMLVYQGLKKYKTADKLDFRIADVAINSQGTSLTQGLAFRIKVQAINPGNNSLGFKKPYCKAFIFINNNPVQIAASEPSGQILTATANSTTDVVIDFRASMMDLLGLGLNATTIIGNFLSGTKQKFLISIDTQSGVIPVHIEKEFLL